MLTSFHVSSAFLPLYSSIFHRTNVEIAQDRSEDILQNSIAPSSRGRRPWRRRVLSCFDLTLCNRLANNLLAQHQSTFFHRWVKFLWMGWQEYVFLVFVLAFDRLAKARAFDFNEKLSNCISEVSCSLLSFSLLLLNSVTNLFKPWEILTHEWELSFYRFNSDFHAIFTL